MEILPNRKARKSEFSTWTALSWICKRPAVSRSGSVCWLDRSLLTQVNRSRRFLTALLRPGNASLRWRVMTASTGRHCGRPPPRRYRGREAAQPTSSNDCCHNFDAWWRTSCRLWSALGPSHGQGHPRESHRYDGSPLIREILPSHIHHLALRVRFIFFLQKLPTDFCRF